MKLCLPRLLALLIGFSILLVVFPVLAQSGGDYDLRWSSIDAGGGMSSTGGDYSLSGIIGQPDAGFLSGGVYTLGGGFWGGGGLVILDNLIFLPLVMSTP